MKPFICRHPPEGLAECRDSFTRSLALGVLSGCPSASQRTVHKFQSRTSRTSRLSTHNSVSASRIRVQPTVTPHSLLSGPICLVLSIVSLSSTVFISLRFTGPCVHEPVLLTLTSRTSVMLLVFSIQ